MRYRWKLMALLLIMALLPIWVMRYGFVRTVHTLGDQITTQAGAFLTEEAEQRYRLVVKNHAAVVSWNRARLTSVLDVQSEEVKKALASEPTGAAVYLPKHFETSEDMPPGSKPSQRHRVVDEGGADRFLTVSPRVLVFDTTPAASLVEVYKDAARLAGLAPLFGLLNQSTDALILWQEVILRNGLVAVYPATGAVSAAAESRFRPAFQAQNRQDEKLWSLPYTDPATGQLVMAASSPVFRESGRLAGRTYVVYPMNAVLNLDVSLQYLPQETRFFLANVEKRTGQADPGIQILAADLNRPGQGRSWRKVGPDFSLDVDGSAAFKPVAADMAAGQGGAVRLKFRGRDSLWVYGPTIEDDREEPLHLIMVAPYSEILQPTRMVADKVAALIDRILALSRYLVLGVFVLVVILSLAFARTVTKPLNILAEGAQRLSSGDFDARVDIRSRDEFGDMGRVFNSVGPRLKEHYRLIESMGLAREVQQNLLPQRAPTLDHLDISGMSVYCDETGGDYYDFIDKPDVSEGDVAVVLGDVAGHGAASALLMASARAYLRQRLAMPGDLAGAITDVNRSLAVDVRETGGFMTLFCAVVDAGDHRICWVRAGHDPALCYCAKDRSLSELAGSGLALGLDESFEYESQSRTFHPGDTVLIGTDGIWEAHDPMGRMFGKERLKRLFLDLVHLSAEEIVSEIVRTVNDYRDVEPQEDDVTLVVIKFPDGGEST